MELLLTAARADLSTEETDQGPDRRGLPAETRRTCSPLTCTPQLFKNLKSYVEELSLETLKLEEE